MTINFLRHISITIFMLSITFLRGNDIFGIGNNYIFLFSGLLFLCLTIYHLNYNIIKDYIFLSFLIWLAVSFISVYLSLILNKIYLEQVLGYYTEFLVIFYLFLVGLVYANWRNDSSEFTFIIIVCFFVGIYFQLSNIDSVATIRRLTGDLSSRNYAGLIMSICCITFFLNIKVQSKIRYLYITLFIFSFISLFLIGTRSVLIPLILFIIYNITVHSKKIIIYIPLFSLFIIYFLSSSNIEFGPMFDRFFSVESLIGLTSRFELIVHSFNDMNLFSLMLGYPNAYTIFDNLDFFYHPHNFLLSNLIFLGFVSFLASIVLFIFVFIRACRAFKVKDWRLISLSIFLSLFFVSASSEFTRPWILFFLIGMITSIRCDPRYKHNF